MPTTTTDSLTATVSTPDSLAVTPADSLTTAAVDTVMPVAVDSVVAPVAKEKTVTVVEVAPPAWEQGMMPEPRPGHAGHNQGIVATIVLLMLSVALSFNAVKRVLGNITKRLTGTRVRDGFDTDTGVEKRTMLLLLFMTVVFLSILSTAGLTLLFPEHYRLDMSTMAGMTGIMTVYFIFQYAVCNVMGYTFADEENRILWVRGLTASLILMGISLILPGLTVLFYPDFMELAVWVALALYVFARVLFISKSFRIFYTNIASLVYFILYLCSLELVPICVIYFVSTQILQY